jgi:mannose-6-phosphate isomerase
MTTFPVDADSYPLMLEAVAKERIWGGRMLAQIVHKSLPGELRIGETWEAWPGCAIMNGKYAGQTLEWLLRKNARAILGSAGAAAGTFPLLFKYIDARDHLSVQVHPDDAEAQALEGQPFGKTEAWYILHAEPDAAVIHGFREQVSAERFAAALEQGTMAELLSFVPVQAGDVLFVPAGMVHAIGKGIVLAEIQQNSDITYRLYDWDRRDDAGKPRELHVAKGLLAAEFDKPGEHKLPGLRVPHAYGEQHFLVACRYFVWEILVCERAAQDLPLDGKFHIVSVLAGSAAVTFGPEDAWLCEARTGQTLLLPAVLGRYGIVPLSPGCKILRAYVPALRSDVIDPLRRARFDDAHIARLGGPVAKYNDLLSLL